MTTLWAEIHNLADCEETVGEPHGVNGDGGQPRAFREEGGDAQNLGDWGIGTLRLSLLYLLYTHSKDSPIIFQVCRYTRLSPTRIGHCGGPWVSAGTPFMWWVKHQSLYLLLGPAAG